MKRRGLAGAACAVLVGGLLGCAAVMPPATQDAADAAGVSMATFSDARRRYVAKCGGCHPLYRPVEYPAERWVRHVEEMRDRARLTAEDVRLILAYVQGTRTAAARRTDGDAATLNAVPPGRR